MRQSKEFKAAFDLIIGEEGGYVNDPRDPGGETKFGIAKRYHPAEDIPNLTLARAREIYFEQYWCAAGCDRLGWRVAYVFFDAVVNMGSGTALRLMQEALGEVADGIIGPRTRKAMERHGDDPELVVKFQAERALYYASRSHFSRFGRGWMRRVIRGAMVATDPDLRSLR